jgi:hypothetical protein
MRRYDDRSMSASVFERFGEAVGYGLAVVILGPHAALERRARRAMRAAMVEWCRDLQPVKLEGQPGIFRRTAALPGTPGTGGPLSAELELDVNEKRARVGVAIERLPAYVKASIGKAASALHPMLKRRRGPPRATAGGFRLDSQTLDDEVANALVAVVAAGALERLEHVEVALSPERIELLTIAPTTREEWTAIGDGVVALASWLGTRWPSSYRG